MILHPPAIVAAPGDVMQMERVGARCIGASGVGRLARKNKIQN